MDNIFTQNSWQKVQVDTLRAIVLALAISIILYLFVITPNQVDGDSMSPNFQNGDLVLTNKIIQWFGNTNLGSSVGYNYQQGDVVVFQEPGHADFIKRIVAIGGDRVGVVDGDLVINDSKVEEKYLNPSTRTFGGDFLQDGDTRVVPEGQYFVMGDNRNASQDSRFNKVKFVAREHIKGKVIFRYWPLSQLGIIGTGNIDFKST